MTDRGYARISLDNERSGSIAKQREQIARYGGSDVRMYVDESVSGSKVPFAERPAGRALMGALEAGDRVLVTKIDRAARSVTDLLSIVERIEQAGASIVFVEQKIDTAGPMGRFVLTLLAAIAELEAGIIGERRRESLGAFAQEGRHAVGAAPYGFQSVPNPNGRGLVIRPHPEEGPLLYRAIRRVLDGEPQRRVCESIGLKTPRFSALLRNPRLAGMTPHKDGVVMVDGIPRVDKESALLSMNEYMQLQDFLNSKEPRTWSRTDGYGAALKCKACGDRLYLSKGNYPTYKCARRKHERGTPSASVPVTATNEYLEQQFLSGYGSNQVVVSYWSDDGGARDEAIATARYRVDAAREALEAALTDEEDAARVIAYSEARKALREALNAPSERVYRTEHAGFTIAQAWEKADDTERCRMLNKVGEWEVKPSTTRKRMPIEERIQLKPDELLLELLTHPVGDSGPQGFLL